MRPRWWRVCLSERERRWVEKEREKRREKSAFLQYRAISKMDKPNWRRRSLTANFTYARPHGPVESSISLRLFITTVFNPTSQPRRVTVQPCCQFHLFHTHTHTHTATNGCDTNNSSCVRTHSDTSSVSDICARTLSVRSGKGFFFFLDNFCNFIRSFRKLL